MKNVNQDVFASFADAQMSKEEMKMVKGGAEDEVNTVVCGTLNSDARVGETRTVFIDGARVYGKVLSFDSRTGQGCVDVL